MINRNHVRQFLAVVDAGNFTRAANLINVTQPTLSAGISELEKQLGSKLFVREKRRIYLTSAGNQFLIHARKIQQSFRQAEQERQVEPKQERTIHLGVLESFASPLLEQCVTAIKTEIPNCLLMLDEGKENEILSELGKGKLDLALTILPIHYRGDHDMLFEEDYCLMVPSHHPMAERSMVAAQDLANDTMIARRSCELLSQTSKFFTSHGVRPPFAMRSMHEDRIMKMVRSGLGITVAPRSHVIDGVEALLLDGFEYKRRIALLYGDNWLSELGRDHILEQAIMKPFR